MTTGLVIGKFMPPHAGHLRLFSVAQSQVDELDIVLFSKLREPIPGALRLAWLRELWPSASLWHITREHPVDFNDPQAWDFWVSAIRDALPNRPKVVFTSEAYGDELARRLGARHVSVDPTRKQVPISATQIRARPLAHWRYLPPPVRRYYLLRLIRSIGATTT